MNDDIEKKKNSENYDSEKNHSGKLQKLAHTSGTDERPHIGYGKREKH
jgi:hypothetical protein